MIRPITQINNNAYRHKNIAFRNVEHVSKSANIATNDDKTSMTSFQKKLLYEQVLQSFALLFIAGMFVAQTALKSGKNSFWFSNKKGFESLKNRENIPTLDTCKSINKSLRDELQTLMNLIKADQQIISEAGEPIMSNRMLLCGEPGTGKSFFAKIMAKTLDAEYQEILYSDFDSKWVGEGNVKLKSIFERILKESEKNPDKKYVVVFNEIDAILEPIKNFNPDSGALGHSMTKKEQRSTFLNYLDILAEKTPNVIVIGTTNLPSKGDLLDGAAVSRLKNIIEVPYPDENCLYEALKTNLAKIKNKDKFITNNEKQLKELAKLMSQREFSFRNLEYIVNKAKTKNLENKLKNSSDDFKFEYLREAVNSLTHSDGEISHHK